MRILTTILFLGLSGLVFFFFIDPTYGDIKNFRTNVSTYNAALSNSAELEQARDSLVERYKGIKQDDVERLSHLLPSSINNIELILEIEKIANIHGMPISDVRFDSTMSANKTDTKKEGTTVTAENNPSDYLPYGVFPVEFTVEGRYDTFISFLKELESNLRLVDIKSISFSVATPTEGAQGNTKTNIDTSLFRYTLKIETYWLK